MSCLASTAALCCLQMLHDTFSAFGVIINTPKIMRDPDTGAVSTAVCGDSVVHDFFAEEQWFRQE
jgi:hypothetical protein